MALLMSSPLSPQDTSSENQDIISPPTRMCLWVETGPSLWGLADLLVQKWPSDHAVPVALAVCTRSTVSCGLLPQPLSLPAGCSSPVSAHSSHSVMACGLDLGNRP